MPNTPPSTQRVHRPPRIIINSGTNKGSLSSAVPPVYPPYTPQSNLTAIGTAAPTDNPYWPPYANPFAAGSFMTKGFEGFVDFTKSGLSFGEKFTYGLYEKFSKWSKKWFTHIFLFFVVALYSVGGAVVFTAVEGRQAEKTIIDARAVQNELFKAVQKLARDNETLKYRPDEFNAQLVYTLRKHDVAVKTFINTNQTLEEIQNPKNRWTFWNAMFYCGTIYTTIGKCKWV